MSPAGGIYVHLPYCASRCGYCAFVVTTDGSSRERYLEALAREIGLVAEEAAGAVFDSVYLGGGTPSLLPSEAIARLLELLRERFAIAAGSEVTLEANPEDVSPEAVAAWRSAGVNRVSVGVQSLSDVELEAVGRRHDAFRAREALATLAGSGLSISADLILGLPGQTQESFGRNLAGLADSGIEHVSVYLLEVEKSKTLEDDRRSRPERYLPDDGQADAWLALCRSLEGRGFEHYEISNWARPGRRGRHNGKYWVRADTLGLGVAAHELWRDRRRENVSSLEQYVARLAEGKRPVALDRAVPPAEAERERVFLGLRLAEGVPVEWVEPLVSSAEDPRLRGDYEAWFAEGILQQTNGRVRFSERGFLVSNEVLSRFV